MNFLFDTNTLYYLCGIQSCSSNLDRLRRKINNAESINISSITMYEVLNKSTEEIQVVTDYISLNKINLIQSRYLPFDKNDFQNNRNITRSELRKLKRKYMPVKIDREALMTTIILTNVIVAYFTATIDSSNNTFDDDIHSNFLLFIFQLMKEISLNFFKSEYKNGYDLNDCEKYIKNKFYSILESLIALFTPFISEGMKANTKEEFVNLMSQLQKEDISQIQDKIKTKLTRQVTSVKFVEKFANKYKKTEEDKNLFTIFSHTLNNIVELNLTGFGLKRYLEIITHNCIFNGYSFLKNDIADALIINHINDNLFLITFENKIKNFLELYSTNEGFSKSFKMSSIVYNWIPNPTEHNTFNES